MYKNLQEIALEDDQTTKTIIIRDGEKQEPMNRGKLAQRYIEELTYYDPFSYEIQNPEGQKSERIMIN